MKNNIQLVETFNIVSIYKRALKPETICALVLYGMAYVDNSGIDKPDNLYSTQQALQFIAVNPDVEKTLGKIMQQLEKLHKAIDAEHAKYIRIVENPIPMGHSSARSNKDAPPETIVAKTDSHIN